MTSAAADADPVITGRCICTTVRVPYRILLQRSKVPQTTQPSPSCLLLTKVGCYVSRLTLVRQRKVPVEAVEPVVAAPAPSRNVKAKNEGPGLVKILALVLLVVSGFVAHSWYFGQKGERTFTLRQLSAYDGSNPDLPVYVSVGGDVYDVSSNKRIYGKGGAYNMM